MKRRTFLAQAGAGLATTAIAAPAIAQPAPQVKWRLASSFPKSLDTIYGAGAFFCERVGKLTDGKFEITPYAAGQIVPPLQVLDAVQQGTVECGHTASYYYVGKNRAFAFGCAIPFGLTSRQQSAWEYAGGGLELLRDFYKEYGIIHFPAGNTGTQMGGWFKKEIKTVADLKGLKMRIPGIGGEVMGRLGAVPQALPGSEIYAALERGVIDAAEWVGPYDDEKLGLYKIAKHYYYPAFWEGGTELCVMINAAAWDKLPKVLSGGGRVRRRRGPCQDAGAVRRQEPDRAQEPDRERRQAASVPARPVARRQQGRLRALRGGGGEEPGVQEALRALEEVPRAAVRVVQPSRSSPSSR